MVGLTSFDELLFHLLEIFLYILFRIALLFDLLLAGINLHLVDYLVIDYPNLLIVLVD